MLAGYGLWHHTVGSRRRRYGSHEAKTAEQIQWEHNQFHSKSDKAFLDFIAKQKQKKEKQFSCPMDADFNQHYHHRQENHFGHKDRS